jgi:hypothetical protein
VSRAVLEVRIGNRAPSRRLCALLLVTLVGIGCQRPPSRRAALESLTRSPLSHDTSTVVRRVWEDGPPWFSCAEVIAKFDGHADRAVVHDEVGNWRPLVVVGWATLRDTSAGRVVEPGWCVVRLTDQGKLNAGGWVAITGDTFPTRRPRRGWLVPVGHQRLIVPATPELTSRDSASASYVVTVAVNANGVALGADRDSLHRKAMLVRTDSGWQVVSVRDAVRETNTP